MHALRRRLVTTVVVASAALAFLISSAADGKTFQLELKRLKDPTGRGVRSGSLDHLCRMTYPQRFYMDTRGTRRVVKAPDFATVAKKQPGKYKCEHPFRDVARLGSDHYAFVLDSTDLKSKGYDLLHFDLNHNGDLTDDKVVKATPLSGSRRSRGTPQRTFPCVEVTVNAEGTKVDYAFYIRTRTHRYGSGQGEAINASAYLQSVAYRDGQVVLDGKRHRIIVIDFNSNGRFDDETKIDPQVRLSDGRLYPKQGDMLLIDPDTKNAMVSGYGVTDRRERHLVSSLVCIGGRYYDMEMSAAGDKISLEPTGLPMGSVVNASPSYDAVLFSDKVFVKISGEANKPVPLPLGDWRLLQYAINASKSGQPPTFVSAGATRDGKPVKVAKGATAKLAFGPPYTPEVTVSSPSRGGQPARLGLKIVGAGGEICSNLQVRGNRPEAPSFEIATPKGKVIERGKFKYG